MSFRNRLLSFFVVIVLVPMLAIGVLVFRLISDSNQAKAESRANGLAAAAASVYTGDESAALADARPLAAALASHDGSLGPAEIRAQLVTLARDAGLTRIVVARNGHVLADIGGGSGAIAPSARVDATVTGRSTEFAVVASTTTASAFVQSLARGNGIILREGRRVLDTNLSALPPRLPDNGDVTIGGTRYDSATARLPGFTPAGLQVTMLSPLRATASSMGTSRALAIGLIIGFLVLSVSFAILASRGLEGQIGRFLRAAQQLGRGDFSAPVPVEGNDEFAMLATEFNRMSEQLAQRLDELHAERERLRESIRRAGQTFASNLDRQALLELALKTAATGVAANFGRVTIRYTEDGPLRELAREGSLVGTEAALLEAEQQALRGLTLALAVQDSVHVVSVPLLSGPSTGRPHGLVTVGRGDGMPFSRDDEDLLRSLVGQAALALENVELHEEVQRQAVTDELTGLANHGRFQEVLGSEMDQVRRYHYPVGLIMLDIDNFKRVNDTYGHPQGDLVLKQVARVLKDTSRLADSAARYGGEEMALILPHTDLEGSYAIAERIRTAIADLHVPRLDGQGLLEVTASLGVGATTDGEKQLLISETDAALYRAKRNGKNQTVRATATTANVVGAE